MIYSQKQTDQQDLARTRHQENDFFLCNTDTSAYLRPTHPAMFMLRQIFRRKSLDAILHETDEPQHQLKRALGPFDVTMLGIGAIIGAGIFATIGTAAAGDVA